MELTKEQIRLLLAVTCAYRTGWFTSEQVYELGRLRMLLQDADSVTLAFPNQAPCDLGEFNPTTD